MQTACLDHSEWLHVKLTAGDLAKGLRAVIEIMADT